MVIFEAKRIITDVNLSEEIGLQKYIRPNDNLDFAFVDATFFTLKGRAGDESTASVLQQRLENEMIFVTMFLPSLNEIVPLEYSFKEQKTVKIYDNFKLTLKNGSHKDFPISSFFDEKRKQIIVIMRLGEAIFIDLTTNNKTSQILTEKNCVRAFFYNNEIVILKESRALKLYQITRVKEDEEFNAEQVPGTLRLAEYYQINSTGFISFQAGQPFIRIISDKHIKTYRFNYKKRRNYIPEHVHTFVNFNQITNMVFDNQD